jgi:hypothetical protein
MLNSQTLETSWTKGREAFLSRTKRLDANFEAALRLHEYLANRHWDCCALVGPDVGIRFNYRIGRFVKGYLRRLRWNDNYCYVQAQGYWILSNWQLFRIFGQEKYLHFARSCSEYLLAQQRNDGAWVYPNPEWHGRIATAEGTWGSLGLLESFRQTGDAKFLEGAQKWYEFVVQKIGFQQAGEELAVNYFHSRKGSRIPNNSAFFLRFLAELARVTGQDVYLRLSNGLLKFLQAAQKPTGEFPYAVKGESRGKCPPHFQCYQYNAFACLDLMRYCEFSGDNRVLPMIQNVLSFLCQGLAKDGHAFFDCGNRYREIIYHTAVLAQAFARARRFGFNGCEAKANRAYSYLLKSQRPDGSFGFSRRDYFLLSDQRSYPRSLAMILYQLLPVAWAGVHQTAWPVHQS